jgi:hypothetical protein
VKKIRFKNSATPLLAYPNEHVMWQGEQWIVRAIDTGGFYVLSSGFREVTQRMQADRFNDLFNRGVICKT